MPKVPSISPTKRSSARTPRKSEEDADWEPNTPSSSPTKERKARTPRKPKSTGAGGSAEASSSNPSTWRPSRIPEGRRITTGLVEEQYRLRKRDREGLQYDVEETLVKQNGQDNTYSMHLYSERAVERRAWEKHGGPEGFEAYLEKLRSTWVKKNPHKPFPRPISYGSPDGEVYILQLSPPNPRKEGEDAYVRSPKLLRLKSQFPQKWIWEACNKAMDVDEDPYWFYESRWSRKQDRERLLQGAIADRRFERYPIRPADNSLPNSASSVMQLREVLGRAPNVTDHYGEPAIEVKDLDRHEDWEGNVSYEWSTKYLEDIFGALIRVISEHGVGEDGWEAVRWEIYDKYSECLGGISVNGDHGDVHWYDGAYDWLLGRLDTKSHEFHSHRGKCKNGQVYNKMLPVLAGGA